MQQREVINGRFEIDRLAGAGGMGTVYRAIDRQTGAPVALKVINAGHSPEIAERFQREMAVLAELQHPGIVRFVANGATPDGQPYLVMEWLEGESLVERLARGVLSVDETVDLGRRVATALSVAHARGVVHRDLKPGNLFLPGKDLARVMVLDFGIARVVEDGRSLTSTGATLGSPGYISPEAARGQRKVDTRADVFSLACVLFRCLTGRPPFTGDLIQVMMQTVMEPAPLAGSLREGIPPALEDLLQRMLAKSPDARPRDAAAVAAELTALAPTAPHRVRRPVTGHGTVALSAMQEPPSPFAQRPISSPPGPPPTPLPPSQQAPAYGASWPAPARDAVSSTPAHPSPPNPGYPPRTPVPPSAAQLVTRSAPPPRLLSPPPPSYPVSTPPIAPAPPVPYIAGAPGVAFAPPITGAPPAPPSYVAGAHSVAGAPAPSAPRPRRSRAVAWVIAVGVLLVAGAVGAFLAFGDALLDDKAPPAVPTAKRKAR